MPPGPQDEIVPHDLHAGAMVRRRGGAGGATPSELFCASPTVLEAINNVLYHRGLRTLSVEGDGTIGPTDPLLGRVEYVPSPFVL